MDDYADSSSSGDDSREGSPDAPLETQESLEPLACVACRSRKLKCDRTKPACGRCTKAGDGTICVYPESRRKPLFKRRNVKDIEARLAQVEGLLKDGPSLDRNKNAADHHGSAPVHTGRNGAASLNGAGVFSVITEAENDGGSYNEAPPPVASVDEDNYPSELVDLGMSEAPPPYEVIESLHTTYFQNQHMFMPMIHRARYLKAFHSAPHLRPPMGLQYAIWAMSSQVHRKYSGFHDAFYRRARQYLENDEMKGHGEQFVTIGHAQAWALLAAYEARRLFFTRAAMSCARCVRLVGMMGLNRLDDVSGGDRIAATLLPPVDWTELEERRRVYWGAFCADSHASISTGWPSLINASDATTHLPSSEEAFNQGIPQPSCSIDNIFSGSSYSTFSSAILICHLFNSILHHVQLKPGDRPEDFEYGPFWQRHRGLDTKMSSAFVFLPERYRLPGNFRDPVAVHTNLNLHAATVCLHNAAVERAEIHNMPASVIKDSQDRMLAAAQAIVNIVQETTHMAANFKSPLASLSLYCAASVFIYQAMMHEKNQTQDSEAAEKAAANVEFVMGCMDNGRGNSVTRLLLHQAILDIDSNGLTLSKHFSWFKRYSKREIDAGHYVPVLARSAVSRHTWVKAPMANWMPMINAHNTKVMKTQNCCTAGSTTMCASCRSKMALAEKAGGSPAADTGEFAKKRRRMQSPEVEMSPIESGHEQYAAAFVVLPDRTAASPSPSVESSADAVSTGPVSNSSSKSTQSGTRSPIATRGNLTGAPPLGTAQQPDVGLFSAIPLSDLWNGSSSSGIGHAALGHAAFVEMPGNVNGIGNGSGPQGVLQHGQADIGLPLDVSFLYSPLGDGVRTNGFDEAAEIPTTVSADAANHFDTADPWTTFLQTGDFDGTDWGATGSQQP